MANDPKLPGGNSSPLSSVVRSASKAPALRSDSVPPKTDSERGSAPTVASGSVPSSIPGPNSLLDLGDEPASDLHALPSDDSDVPRLHATSFMAPIDALKYATKSDLRRGYGAVVLPERDPDAPDPRAPVPAQDSSVPHLRAVELPRIPAPPAQKRGAPSVPADWTVGPTPLGSKVPSSSQSGATRNTDPSLITQRIGSQPNAALASASPASEGPTAPTLPSAIPEAPMPMAVTVPMAPLMTASRMAGATTPSPLGSSVVPSCVGGPPYFCPTKSEEPALGAPPLGSAVTAALSAGPQAAPEGEPSLSQLDLGPTPGPADCLREIEAALPPRAARKVRHIPRATPQMLAIAGTLAVACILLGAVIVRAHWTRDSRANSEGVPALGGSARMPATGPVGTAKPGPVAGHPNRLGTVPGTAATPSTTELPKVNAATPDPATLGSTTSPGPGTSAHPGASAKPENSVPISAPAASTPSTIRRPWPRPPTSKDPAVPPPTQEDSDYAGFQYGKR